MDAPGPRPHDCDHTNATLTTHPETSEKLDFG